MKISTPRWIKLFFEHAHELGALYYGYALLSALTTGAYSLYKFLSQPNLSGATEWSFWVFVVGVALLALVVPVFGFALFKRLFQVGSQEQVANPHLMIIKRDVSYTIKRGHLIKKQAMRVEALDKVECFKFSVGLTGTGTTKVALGSNGTTLKGPSSKGALDHYEIYFATPLLSGQTITFEFDIEVNDPNQTMRTFLSERFHNAAGYGEFAAKYLFEELPKAIKRERLSVAGETLETTEMLHRLTTEGRFMYDFSITKVDAHCVYTVSWVW